MKSLASICTLLGILLERWYIFISCSTQWRISCDFFRSVLLGQIYGTHFPQWNHFVVGPRLAVILFDDPSLTAPHHRTTGTTKYSVCGSWYNLDLNVASSTVYFPSGQPRISSLGITRNFGWLVERTDQINSAFGRAPRVVPHGIKAISGQYYKTTYKYLSTRPMASAYFKIYMELAAANSGTSDKYLQRLTRCSAGPRI